MTTTPEYKEFLKAAMPECAELISVEDGQAFVDARLQLGYGLVIHSVDVHPDISALFHIPPMPNQIAVVRKDGKAIAGFDLIANKPL